MSDIKICDVCGRNINGLVDFYLEFDTHYAFNLTSNVYSIPQNGDICAKCCARIFKKEETENDRHKQRDSGFDRSQD